MISLAPTVEFLVLLTAAICDFRYRKIFDGLIILLVINSFFSNVSVTQRMAAFFIPLIFMFPLAMKYESLKGGDIKFISAVGAFFGLYRLSAILFMSIIVGFLYCLIKKEKSFPLAFVTLISVILIYFTEVLIL